DIIMQLKNQDIGEELLLSSSMTRWDKNIFLDDYTIQDVEKALDTRIRLVENDGYDLLDAILNTIN
ncbi:MAG: DUF512 domain-containing protein, partial [Oscillospiraceae bacterium]|nr:DUF512 domain-containing protein [Oscillospiraceae bacterium]